MNRAGTTVTFARTFLLILILWAGLAALAAYNFRRAVASEREYVKVAFQNPWEHFVHHLFSSMTGRQRDDYARQRIRLGELALATKSETTTMVAAEEAFQRIQQRYGRIQSGGVQNAVVVSIPQVWFPERKAYAWRLDVPPGQRLELAAYVDGGGVPSRFDSSSFVQPLPAGECVIEFLCEASAAGNHQQREWGSFAAKDLAEWGNRLTVTINEVSFHWCSEFSSSGPDIDPALYPSQQTLFESKDVVELMSVAPTSAIYSAGSSGVGRERLHLIVRRSKRTPPR